MSNDNMKRNAPPPGNGRDRERERERARAREREREEYEEEYDRGYDDRGYDDRGDGYDAAPRTRTWGFVVGAVLLLAVLTVVLCVMGGVFDFNRGSSETEPPAAETQAPQTEQTAPPAENTPAPTPTPPEESEAHEMRTVNAIAGNGGSISPSGIVEVEDGGSVTFTITADEGYELSELKVDGYTAEVSGSYTFTNVTGEHTIYAIFREVVPETPTPTPSPTPVETVDPYWPYVTVPPYEPDSGYFNETPVDPGDSFWTDHLG